MLQSIMIYPYNKNYEPLLRHRKLLEPNKIISIVCPLGWNVNNAIFADEDKRSLVVRNDFSNALDECDVVWFVEDANLQLPWSVLNDRIKEVLSKKKQIIYTRYKNNFEFTKVQQMIPKNLNISPVNQIKINNKIDKRKYCYDIDIPIICVLGADEYTDKFEVQLALREALLAKGYRVSSVSSRYDSEIVGLHSMPDFMIKKSLSEAEKILKYNHLIKQIEIEEKPEIIIVGLPGGSIPYNKYNFNNFGILHYEVSQALTFDFSVMCLPYFHLFEKACSYIGKDTINRYRINIDAFHVAPVLQDEIQISNDHLIDFLTLDTKFINTKILSYKNDKVYNLRMKDNVDKLVQMIIKKLS